MGGKAGEPFGDSYGRDAGNSGPYTGGKELNLVGEGCVSVYESRSDGYFKLGFGQEPQEPQEIVTHVVVGGHHQGQEAQTGVMLVGLVVLLLGFDGFRYGVVVPVAPALSVLSST